MVELNRRWQNSKISCNVTVVTGKTTNLKLLSDRAHLELLDGVVSVGSRQGRTWLGASRIPS